MLENRGSVNFGKDSDPRIRTIGPDLAPAMFVSGWQDAN
jgi:hypothetical protein